ATASGEAHTAYKGGFIPLNHPGPYTNVSITDDATSPQAIVAQGNYTVTPAGIQILEDAADIEDGDGILVTYTYPAYDRVQGLTQSAPELEIFFEGQNEARGDAPVTVRMYKVKLGAAAELALLSGDDFGALQLTGQLLKD